MVGGLIKLSSNSGTTQLLTPATASAFRREVVHDALLIDVQFDSRPALGGNATCGVQAHSVNVAEPFRFPAAAALAERFAPDDVDHATDRRRSLGEAGRSVAKKHFPAIQWIERTSERRPRPLVSKTIDFEGLAANRACGDNLLRLLNSQGARFRARSLNNVRRHN